jgi:hypothetical protein
MSHLDILLPFGLPQEEMAGDLLRELKTPALATLLARAKSCRDEQFDPFSHALPHENWLSRQFELDRGTQADNSPAVAAAAMRAFGLAPDAGVWFMLNPVHLHIARDHLILTDPRQLALAEPESRALFAAAAPLFEEFGNTVLYGDAGNWFVCADAWHALQTSTPDAACGHNIDIWMPKGSGERDWRKLQNEVQMQWHAHPVNAERESRNQKPVNSIWLWGGAPATTHSAPARYDNAFNLSGWGRAFGQLAGEQMQGCTASDVIAVAPECGLLVLDTLIEPALAGDWSSWLSRLHALEADWLQPLLEALKIGKLDTMSLALSHATRLSEFACGKRSMQKFWIKPSLARLVR